MLIIAMPKSASTSLLYTLSKAHRLNGTQSFFSSNTIPDCLKSIHKFHSDIREIDQTQGVYFAADKTIYKQHIPPTMNNREILRSQRKVILLRKPLEIIDAYYRSYNTGFFNGIDGFGKGFDLEEWRINAKELGLVDDLQWFMNQWRNEIEYNPENCLSIMYQDLIENTNSALNMIEDFWRLPRSSTDKLLKKRYTRGFVPLIRLRNRMISLSKQFISHHKMLRRLRLLLKKG